MLEYTRTKNSMYPTGKWDITCPKCGKKYAFFINQNTKICDCGEELPDVRELAESTEARINYYLGGDNE